MWKRLSEVIGRPELFNAAEFADEAARSKNRAALNQAIEAATVHRTTAEWVETLNEAGVPSGPIYTVDQVFADPQVKHLKAAAEVTHPALGTIRIVNQAVGLSRTPASMARATPEPGEHTDEILKELGYDDARIAALRERRVI
jgi:formyl-CoA transferase